jgi:diguanylate cyclase (GGDEF)-like protein/hemerythrin-like metal-binding protein/PAS domain S-box-containing protein
MPGATRKTAGKITSPQPLLNQQERFRIAFELAKIGIGVVGPTGTFIEVNAHLSDIFGIAKEELIGMRLSDLPVPKGDSPAQIPEKTPAKGDPAPITIEKRFLSRQGNVIWVEVSYASQATRNGRPAYSVASFHTITRRKRLQLALEKLASLDPLTKTLNRMSFTERAGVEMHRSGRHGTKLSMVMVDLDHFKYVNDTCGHPAGDQVLRIFAEVTSSCLRIGDLLGRWGGEEFLILLPDTGPSDAEQVSERIRASLEARSFADGVRITASFGVVAQRPGENFAALVARADAAMYQAKQTGRNRVSTNADDLQWESSDQSDHPHFLELYWRKHYECGIQEIDAEHQELFRIANRIVGAIGPNGDGVEIVPLVDELLAHIVSHFRHEEHLLQAIGFPGSEAHRQRHHQLLSHVDDLAARFRKKETTAGALLGFIVHDVVARHMIQEDREFFPLLKKQLPANGSKRRPRNRKPAA